MPTVSCSNRITHPALVIMRSACDVAIQKVQDRKLSLYPLNCRAEPGSQ